MQPVDDAVESLLLEERWSESGIGRNSMNQRGMKSLKVWAVLFGRRFEVGGPCLAALDRNILAGW